MGEKDIAGAFRNNSTILTFIIILTVLILLFSLGSGFGQDTLEKTSGTVAPDNSPAANAANSIEGNGNSYQPQPSDNITGGRDVSLPNQNPTGATGTPDFTQNMYNTLYHPKVLGLILIMFIVVMAMIFLTVKEG